MSTSADYRCGRQPGSVRGRVTVEPRGLLDLTSLSEQERNVLDLVALGLTNREIAERLHLAEKTVRNYVSNVLTKLGSRNRTEAAVRITRMMHRSHSTATRAQGVEHRPQ